MNAAVLDCLVTGYESFIEALTLSDPGDRHVLAAAIHCQAGVIVTINLHDFPEKVLMPYGISAQHPDEFLSHVFDLYPATVCTAVREMRKSLIKPPKSVRELFNDLLKIGLLNTVKLLKSTEDLL